MISLFFAFALLCCLIMIPSATALKIAAITWNMAETDRGAVRDTVIAALKQQIGVPDIIFVGIQEAPYWSPYKIFALDANGELKDAYVRQSKALHCMIFGNCARSDIYLKKTFAQGKTITWNEVILEQGLNYEKVTSLLNLNVKTNQDETTKRYCFLNSHFQTKYNMDNSKSILEHENHFDHLKILYNTHFDKFSACDIWVWGGDFNFRTYLHQDGVLNPSFNRDLIQAYSKVSFGANILETDGNCPDTWKLVDKLTSRFTFENDQSFEIPPFACLPPTFSKTKLKYCETAEIEEHKDGAAIEDKEPVCLKTKDGGNCPNKAMFCLAGDRPASWTDIIFHNTAVGTTAIRTAYGGYYGPSPSDHVPIYMLLNVVHN